MNGVLIIGYGVVGKNLAAEIGKLNPDIYDKYKTEHNSKKSGTYSIGFICVDTPLVNGICDTSAVEYALAENDCEIYVMKSTVPVGTIDRLKNETGKRIVFSPEYYGGTQHCNNFEFAFTIIGGDRADCIAVQQKLQHVYDARHKFFIVDSKTAEMAKFMENAWLATKVAFCCDFYNACLKAGVEYDILRELFTADPRVNPSHTFVYKEHPYYDSHCLNKDVPSIAHQFDMELIKSVILANENKKNNANT